MKRVTYIISDIDKALAFEWIASNINKEKYSLDFILLNNDTSALEKFLITKGKKVTRLNYLPGWRMVLTLIPLMRILRANRPNVIHTHLRVASILGLLSGYILRINKRIFTRHHAASNHKYFEHAVKQDKFLTFLSTDVVSISDVVSNVLIEWEGASPNKVHKIPHGFDLAMFENVSQHKAESLRKKYVQNAEGPIVGIISRYLELKGIEYTIEAFIKFSRDEPNSALDIGECDWAL